MDLLLINDTKLKVTLSQDDMSAYSLTCDSIDYDNTETRRAFWSILDEAKHKTGFDAASDKIFIQIYPSRSGGCEMFVTKLSQTPERSLCLVNKQMLNCEKAVCKFKGLTELLTSCNCLSQTGFYGDSSAWYDESGNYYLITGSVGTGAKSGLATYSDIITEFGERINPYAEVWIREHCRCICPENAVGALAVLV